MNVIINLATYLQPYADNNEKVEVRGNTIEDCINNLVENFPNIKIMLIGEDGKILPYVNIFLNEETVYPDQLTTPVKDNDEIYLLYLIGGG
jgi:molybdopterin converting factor small subunit